MRRYQVQALKPNWREELLQQRTDNNEAIAEAHIDAGLYGQGWLKVDEFGNLKRIDPMLISIHVSPEQE